MKTKSPPINEIIARLKTAYPDTLCALAYDKPHELLFAVRLAAQCTDERVNTITPKLYARFPTLQSFADADIEEVAAIVRPCGFFNSKARDIVLCARMLVERYGGELPDTMDGLLTLPGVGRKTANLILGDVFNKPAVVVDTHCIRLSNRMGLVNTEIPEKIEVQLREILPPDESNAFCHRLVLHGRAICKARKPDCDHCVLSDICARVRVGERVG